MSTSVGAPDVVVANGPAELDRIAALDRAPAPGLAGLLAALRRAAPREEWDFARIRAEFETIARAMPVPESVGWAQLQLADRPTGLATPVRARRVCLYLHGGAYTIGSPATTRGLASRFAEAAACLTYVLDYRLAPEHPYPAAVEDAVAAVTELHRRHPDLPLVLAGDSAGGGLALRTALATAGPDGPAAVVAMSPWTDLRPEAIPGDDVSPDPQAPSWLLRRSAEVYAAADRAAASPAAAPDDQLLRAAPILVQVGTAERLYGDGVAFARRVWSAGGNLTLECWPGQLHVFQAFGPRLQAANAALARAADWLEEVAA